MLGTPTRSILQQTTYKIGKYEMYVILFGGWVLRIMPPSISTRGLIFYMHMYTEIVYVK